MVPFNTTNHFFMLSTLRAHLTVTCVAIVLVALSCSALMTYGITRNEAAVNLRTSLAAVTNSNARAIEEWVRSRSAMVAAVGAKSDAPDLLPALRQLEASGGFTVAYAGYPDKRAVFSRESRIPPNYDPTQRPWYQAAVAAGKLQVTPPYADAVSKKLVVTFARPVQVNGRLEAVVAADVHLEGIDAIVEGIHPTPRSFAFIVDSQGRVIAHPNAKLSLRPATELAPALTAALLARLGDVAVKGVRILGRSELLQGAPIAGTDWKLVVAQDKAEGMAGVWASLKADIAALVAVAVIAGGFIMLTVSTLGRRREPRSPS
jgi:methyl-accepting chemotaxis protein